MPISETLLQRNDNGRDLIWAIAQPTSVRVMWCEFRDGRLRAELISLQYQPTQRIALNTRARRWRRFTLASRTERLSPEEAAFRHRKPTCKRLRCLSDISPEYRCAETRYIPRNGSDISRQRHSRRLWLHAVHVRRWSSRRMAAGRRTVCCCTRAERHDTAWMRLMRCTQQTDAGWFCAATSCSAYVYAGCSRCRISYPRWRIHAVTSIYVRPTVPSSLRYLQTGRA